MKLRIDSTVCMAHGRCYALAPELVEVDDQGYPVLTAAADDLAADQEPLADEVVGTCPEGAISLVRE
ncbi:ferredoxin [Jatrophihabitans endophyticus]|uniref:Ferredoxin n=1 Tax=Jatrophihabitans endophyticus TaxID=1206085 RepID=A0A1M5PWA0_9ACTN|nr:ferredoxin [Jatrophihabitans endophyticus]SHH06297.1 ferredoxin [Jatrophihabitans endophyticus]